MNLHAHLTYGRLDFIRSQIDLFEAALGHREQRLLRPLGEPVDGTAVDDRGEHAAARAEGRADGRHTEHNVQVVAHAVDEELVDACKLGLDTCNDFIQDMHWEL